MKTNKLCTSLSRYSKEIDGNIKYLLAILFDRYNIVHFKSISRFECDSHVVLSTEDNKDVILNITKDRVCLIIKNEYYVEEHIVTSAGDIYSTTYEQRPRGIIVSEGKREYRTNPNNKDEKICTNLSVNRYCFSSKTIGSLLPNFYDSQYASMDLDKFRSNYHEDFKCIAESIADLKSYYSSYIQTRYMNMYSEGEAINYDSSMVHVFINGQEISYYDMLNGDRLNVAYDLFMGKINKYTLDEILSIRNGELDPDAFDLYSKLGLDDKEDAIVYSSLSNKKKSTEDSKVLSKYFNCRFFQAKTKDDIMSIINNRPLTEEGKARIRK